MGMNFVKVGDTWELAPNPGYEGLLGLNIVIGAKYDRHAQVWNVEGLVEATSMTPRFWRLRRLDGRKLGESVLKSDAEISALEGAGRFRLASMSPGNGGRKPKVPSISLVGTEVSPILWWTARFLHGPNFALSKGRFDGFVTEQLERADPAMPTEKPPSFSKMRRYYLKYEQTLRSDPQALAIHRENGGGRPRNPWVPKVAAMIAIAVERESMMPRPQGAGARLLVQEMLKEEGLPLEGNLPSLRTMQDRMAEVPDVVKTSLSEGDDHAEKEHGHRSIRPKPDLPLEVCEADEVWLNGELLDDETYVNLGRACVLFFIDLCTGIVLSGTVGLAADFELAVRGIRRAIYPWTSPFEGVVHRWYGTFGCLRLDGAKYNHGGAMTNLGIQAGFAVGELPKKRPKMKGTIEGFVGHFNRTVAHNQAGSVMGNVLERAKFEDMRIPPLLTIGEMQGIVDDWVANHRNVELVDGFGPFGKTKDIPDRRWKKDIRKVSRLPLEPEIFDRVTGSVEWRTIQEGGVRIDHLVYWSDQLLFVVADKRHKPGKGKHCGTLYKIIGHANDVGRKTFVDPYRNISFELRVQAAQRRYADNLPMRVHKLNVADLAEGVADLTKKLELKKSAGFKMAHQARSLRKVLGIDERLEQFGYKQSRRRIAGEIRPATESASASKSMVDLTALPKVPATELAGRTKLGRALDPDRDPSKARRFANPQDGGAEIDRALVSEPQPRVSTLTVDPDADLADLYDDGEA